MSKNTIVATYGIKGTISQGLSAALIIATVIFAAYSVVLSSNFGIMDDYIFLYNAIVGNNETFTALISCGRPLNALLLELGFHLTGSIENLAILRAITLFGIWLLGCSLYVFSRLHSVSFISSLAIACGIVLLPSFQVYTSWAQHFTTPFAGTIALISAFILTPSCTIRKRSRGLSLVLSVFLLVMSILIYQPIAMLFCTGILISVLSKPDIYSDWKSKRVIEAATVFVIAMLLGLIVFKIGQYMYPNHDSLRFGLVQNIHEKLYWFFSEPLANALSLYSIPANTTVQFMTLLTILVGASFFIAKYSLKTASLVIFYGVLCIIGSYAPNLATAENWPSYRSIGALGASVVVMLVILISESISYIQEKYTMNTYLGVLNKNLWVILFILLVILATRVQSNVLNGFVLPNATELNNLASFLKDGINEKPEDVTIIIKPSSWTDSAAKPMAYDEFGMPSSINESYAKRMLQIVLYSMNLMPNVKISTAKDTVTKRQSNHVGDLIVDYPHLVTSQRFKTAPSASLNSMQAQLFPLNVHKGVIVPPESNIAQ